MHGSLVFIPGICSDDGRAITGWWNLYTRAANAFKNSFWNEPKHFNTKEEAERYCKDQNIEIVSIAST